MRALLALALVLFTSTSHAGNFRRWVKNKWKAPHSASATFLTDNCAGTSIALGDGTPITWTRSTGAYCTKDTTGALQLLSANKPRCAGAGCFIESRGVNIITNSYDFSSVDWTQNTITLTQGDVTCNPAPDGTNTAWRAVADADSTDAYVGFLNYSITTAQPYALSVWSKKASDNAGTPVVAFDNALPTQHLQNLALGTTWFRNRLNTTSDGDTGSIRLGGASTFTAADNAICLWAPQQEQRDFATSTIPDGQGGIRAADIVTIQPPSWFTNVQGCASVSVFFQSFTNPLVAKFLSFLSADNSGTTQVYAGIADGSYISGSSGTWYAFSSLDSNLIKQSITAPGGTTKTVLTTWNPPTLSVTSGSTASVSTYTGQVTTNSTLLYLGVTTNNSQPATYPGLNGFLSALKLGSTPTSCP